MRSPSPRVALVSMMPATVYLLALGLAPSAQSPRTAPLRFEAVGHASGIARFQHTGGSTPDKRYIPEVMSGGVCAADFDRDGWSDLIFVNGGSFATATGKAPPPPHGVFRNRRDGTFEDMTPATTILNAGWGMGCAIADYDEDGDPDLYVTNFLTPNQLWRNDGAWRFRDVTSATGTGGPAGRWNTAATFGDYDGDGRLDLFVAGYVRIDPKRLPEPGDIPDCRHRGLVVNCGPRGLPGEGDLLFHNEGNGTYRAVPLDVDPKQYYGLGAVFLALEEDRPPLLYVANDSTPNALYRFDGNTLADVAMASGVGLSEEGHEQAGMGIAWGDADGDGRLDLYVTNFVDDYNTLYRALDGRLFEDVTRRAKLAQPTWLYMGWGTGFGDFDLDGASDLVVANGHVYPQVDELKLPSKWRMPVQVFRNAGNGTFDELPRDAVPGAAVGRGLALADFWNDGRLGFAINNLDGPAELYRPVTPQGRYIEITLVGDRIRDATGARVDARWGSHRVVRLVASGGSYLSSHDPRVHIGVGQATAVDLEITWPGGRVQTLRGIATNRLYRLREGSALEPWP